MRMTEVQVHKDSKISEVTLNHKGKNYYGTAMMHPEEKMPFSNFFGAEIAEQRAWIEFFKEKRDINRIKKEAMVSFKNDIENYLSADDFNNEKIRFLYEKINYHISYYDKETKNFRKLIKDLKNKIKESVKTRTKIYSNK